MRRVPPPLACSSGLAGAWRIAASATVGAAAAVLAGWGAAWASIMLALPSGGLRAAAPGIVALALLAGSLASAGAWRHLPRGGGRLSYDGACWRLARPATSSSPADLLQGHPAIALDLGPWMLLRFHPAAARTASGHGRCSVPGVARRPLWLPLAAAADPRGWPALRAALWTWRPDRDPSARLNAPPRR